MSLISRGESSGSRRRSWSIAQDTFGSQRRSNNNSEQDEELLIWASLEKLPTYDRLRKTVIQSFVENKEGEDGGETNNVNRKRANKDLVDVRMLGENEFREFINRNFNIVEEDNDKFLSKIRNHFDKVGISLPTVETRFENISVEAECFVGERALPTLPNTVKNIVESALSFLGINMANRAKLSVLKDVSGIIKPSRITLLLGPPSSGKTTLLKALCGNLDSSLKLNGKITYNGYELNEFVPQKTSAYISQNDIHVAEMTVKETLDFSTKCLGVGYRYELLTELARRQKEVGIIPDAEVDLFMKATSMEDLQYSLITDYVLKILGLDICRDTIVGDEMIRGISGGQKKRVTTGEMIVGPMKVLFMDEISTGLDSSTTFQIVKCLQQIVHHTEATIFVSLLQPTPETFDLFDDIILLSEGRIVYQGPRYHVLEFFKSCGFDCPGKKAIANFLQEVTSRKDQEQYWIDHNKTYRYISVENFVEKFKHFHVGLRLKNELSIPFDKTRSHKAALVYKKYSIPNKELLKTSFSKEWLLIKRNSFIYIFKISQLTFMAFLTSTIYMRTNMQTTNGEDGLLYVGALLVALIVNTFYGFSKVSLTIKRLPVFYKQRDLLFHPPWILTLSIFILELPISMIESIIWTAVTYYSVGFAPEASRFFKQLLIIFSNQQMSAGLFRAMAGICKTMTIANTGGALCLQIICILGGFILPKGQIPNGWGWAYWVSPLTYAFNAYTVNEILAPRWMNRNPADGRTRLGLELLKNLDVFPEKKWFWIGVGSLLGFAILFNIIFTFSLMYLKPPGGPQAIISNEQAKEMESEEREEEFELQKVKSNKDLAPSSSLNSNSSDEMKINGMSGFTDVNGSIRNNDARSKSTSGIPPKRGTVIPFTPLVMSFDSINYFVDMPQEMKDQGVIEDKLQLLHNVTGSFRPGVLTALMGVSGAGKTTLMDVLAGRKTGGYIDGLIRISGFPKKQETFSRISGYCEQNDIHSPQLTVIESLIYSAFLRLPKEISEEEKMIFIDEAMDLVELNNIKGNIVGLPGVSGLSSEQRKRLTIAVELVANPSIIFMDEPTSGLDARASAIVMRTIRKTVDTGRTIVCTIHQPSIDIFEAFDELLLMKRGGKVIYAGPLGRHSREIIEYFEAIPGVSKIKEKYNPATWMLEVSSVAMEVKLGIDFHEHYRISSLHERNKTLVRELSIPPQGAKDLYYPTQYSQNIAGQLKFCMWKQWITYWRSPDYNLGRYLFTLASALMIGTTFWKAGNHIETSNDLRAILGVMMSAIVFMGFNNCTSVQPIATTERIVFYRESAAGMYSVLPYAIAQLIVEVPYILVQASYFTVILYSMVCFKWTASKFFWLFFTNFFSFIYFTYYGMMVVALSPNQQVAAILATSFLIIFTLFSGFFIPRPKIPKWWVWYYWICPVAWSMYGLIASQYGDVDETIVVPDIPFEPRIKDFIKEYYGFKHDFMGPVAAVLVGFTLLFAFVYVYGIKILNFQTR